jgi:hypothetical protein
MVVTFASDNIQTSQTKVHKDVLQWDHHGNFIYHSLPTKSTTMSCPMET